MAMSSTTWLFGRSGSGKTTLARQLAEKTGDYLLDGDTIREFTSNRDFSKESRRRHLLYAAFVAQVLNTQGISVICAMITPIESVREQLRHKIDKLQLIYIKCSLAEVTRRDTKGLYAINTPGIDMFEEPSRYDFVVDTEYASIDICLGEILTYLEI